MKKVSLLLILSALFSINAMAITDGWYACKGTDRDGNKVALQFTTSIQERQSCDMGGPGEPRFCDSYLFLDGVSKIVLVDESLQLKGIEFNGDARNPSYLAYGTDHLIARRRTKLELYQNNSNPSAISFSLQRPYKPYVQGVVECEKF